MLKLPDGVLYCMQTLWDKGFAAHIVGGCVRDSLLDKQPVDWDLCTAALPQQIIDAFPNNKVIPTGIAHGTVTVLVEDTPIEITTYRWDGEYTDHRHPDVVTFTSNLKEDLARRDFTVNAMAWHPKTGITDPFGGQADIENRILRCVGDPQKRFDEDALRILRLFRFAAQLDFAIEHSTLAAAGECKGNLQFVSAERIASELKRLLVCPKPGTVLKQMVQQGVLQQIVPEFAACVGFDQHTPYHNRTVDIHTFDAIDVSPPHPLVRLALLLHDVAKPACCRIDQNGAGHFAGHDAMGAKLAEKILQRLRMDTQTIQLVTQLIALHDCTVRAEHIWVKKQLAKLGEQPLRLLLEVKIADNLAKEPSRSKKRLNTLKNVQPLIDEIVAQNPCLSLDMLMVKGHDLLAAGLTGKQVGAMLKQLLELVIEEKIPNDKDKLMAYVTEQLPIGKI